jgi:hypothetical protein
MHQIEIKQLGRTLDITKLPKNYVTDPYEIWK